MLRFCCKSCGSLFLPRLKFMDGNKRYTRSFGLTVLELLQYGTIKDFANYLNGDRDLVKRIHKQSLKAIQKNLEHGVFQT
ncbi:hypothetical protein [Desulforhopalus singaporensis]|uniref:Uncharacterized protein n=1 Tax=Desulforhopalus singaporensis TaxID=91360 RepID=A0A1H0T1A6_9BACT|nr:hypothetical protein [Desulforhopalus singaporensis]SDP47510.1 hypothetical protein SAMN05660330_02891 [Desulforhopalus singaporensis]